MWDQIFQTAIEKYGLYSAIVLYIFKTLWDLFQGNLFHYIKAIDENTKALEKVSRDIHIAFINIKEVREKNQMGPLTKPDAELDQ